MKLSLKDKWQQMLLRNALLGSNSMQHIQCFYFLIVQSPTESSAQCLNTVYHFQQTKPNPKKKNHSTSKVISILVSNKSISDSPAVKSLFKSINAWEWGIYILFPVSNAVCHDKFLRKTKNIELSLSD